MDAARPLHNLPPGFHWEVPFSGWTFPSHLIAVPDEDPDAWLATVSPARGEVAAVATIRRHLGLKDHVSRPFRTDAAALGWVARWLYSQGGAVRAELAGYGPLRPVTAA